MQYFHKIPNSDKTISVFVALSLFIKLGLYQSMCNNNFIKIVSIFDIHWDINYSAFSISILLNQRRFFSQNVSISYCADWRTRIPEFKVLPKIYLQSENFVFVLYYGAVWSTLLYVKIINPPSVVIWSMKTKSDIKLRQSR